MNYVALCPISGVTKERLSWLSCGQTCVHACSKCRLWCRLVSCSFPSYQHWNRNLIYALLHFLSQILPGNELLDPKMHSCYAWNEGSLGPKLVYEDHMRNGERVPLEFPTSCNSINEFHNAGAPSGLSRISGGPEQSTKVAICFWT